MAAADESATDKDKAEAKAAWRYTKASRITRSRRK